MCILYVYVYIYVNYSTRHMAMKMEYVSRDSLTLRKALKIAILPDKYPSVFQLYQNDHSISESH